MTVLSKTVASSLAVIQATGEVACPMKGPLARDKCRELQLRQVCHCPLGRIARLVGASDAIEEHREEERRAAALLQYSAPAKEWVLRCGYRCCGKEFKAKKRFNAKPGFCNRKHRDAEFYARKRDRARLRASLEE